MSRPNFDFQKGKHKYFLDGEEYPSVTTIIKATVPKDLAWWGMTVGVEGVMVLFEKGHGFRVREAQDPSEVTALLTEHKLTVNHQMRSGADRGLAVHKAMEAWGREQKVLDLEEFKPPERPYAQALTKFLVDFEPEIHEQEVITGSIEYQYAGTFDLKCTFRRGSFSGKHGLVDLKTGKRVYHDQHFPQLEAYEQAEIESEEVPSDICAILQLNAEGDYTFAPSTDTFKDFKVLLDHWRSCQKRKIRLKS